jgi:hypothetical protein
LQQSCDKKRFSKFTIKKALVKNFNEKPEKRDVRNSPYLLRVDKKGKQERFGFYYGIMGSMGKGHF